MPQPITSRRLTRRQLLGAVTASGVALAGAAITYRLEDRTLGSPAAEATGLAPALPAGVPAPEVPLLVLTNPSAAPDYSPFLAELLRAEGLVALRSAPLGQVGRAELAGFQVVVLAPGPVSADRAALLHEYVARGGALLGLRPDPRLADLFGVRPLGAAAQGDELRVVAAARELEGFTVGALQVHGSYDRLGLAGARALAQSRAGDPLVTMHQFGRGATALWAFDPAQCVALLRQGNPAAAGEDRDAIPGVRASDLFVGWIDLDRIGVPQADEHQRLLVRIIEELAAEGPPLPRLWYFPGGAPALIVATGDAHGSRVSHVEQVLGAVERRGGTFSVYYTPPEANTAQRLARKARRSAEDLPWLGGLLASDDPIPAPRHVAAWRERGHEFGMHPYVEGGLEQGYRRYWNEFIKYGYGPLPPTVRTHRILWHGWVDNALVQARYGLRMNLDHYHSGSAVRKADGTWAAGYLSGTGLPLRFVGADGRLLSVYQQPTHLVDEHLMNVFDTGHEVGLDGAAAAAVTISQIAGSVGRFPAALGLQCHIDPFLLGGDKARQVGRWLDETLDYATTYGLPVLSAERWLAFTEARAAARVARLAWDAAARRLAFELTLPANAGGAATLLLPLHHGAASLRAIRIDGEHTRHSERMLAGRRYTAIHLPPGRRAIEADYTA